MKIRGLIVTATFGMSACATANSDTRSTITVDGQQYETRTITEDGPTGTFTQTSVKVRNQFYMCLPDSPGDCEAAVQIAVDQRPGGN